MRITTTHDGGTGLLELQGRLDREWAEHLSDTVEDLVQAGVRSLKLDFSGVTYVSSPAAKVLHRWRQQLGLLRGELELVSIPPAIRSGFEVAGWDPEQNGPDRGGSSSGDLRRSSWHAGADFDRNGSYELSEVTPPGALRCRLTGAATCEPIGEPDCQAVEFGGRSFGLGLGAIGESFEQCREYLGELVAAAGCVAYFPSGGSRSPDYLVGSGSGSAAPRALLASGAICEGGFSRLIRFSAKPDANEVPLSELATVGLEAAGGSLAGVILAAETTGLCGVRRRRSPAQSDRPRQFELPEVQEWLSFAPERTHPASTSIVAGVIARQREGPLAPYLRPMGFYGDLFGHFHAAVFSYHALPQRTVDLAELIRRLFANHQLKDVLHLLWDDRGQGAVNESAFLRGVMWVGPITEIG